MNANYKDLSFNARRVRTAILFQPRDLRMALKSQAQPAAATNRASQKSSAEDHLSVLSVELSIINGSSPLMNY